MANRKASYTQAEVTRAVKGTVAGGLTVNEVIVTAESIRLITDDSQERNLRPNSFDEALKERND